MEVSGSIASAVCSVGRGCSFTSALAYTPLILSTAPIVGNEGSALTITGHGFSLLPLENYVSVGGRPCDVTSSTQVEDALNGAMPCEAFSCTGRRPIIKIICLLPSHHSFHPHLVHVFVPGGGGGTPTSPSHAIGYTVQLRSFEPAAGSFGGGTTLTLRGDGLSARLGDIEVRVGSVGCMVIAANYTAATCITGMATGSSSSSSAEALRISVYVRGVAAQCMSGSCLYSYDALQTPVLQSVTVLTKSVSSWQVQVGGSRFAHPASANSISVGGIPCGDVSGSSTQLTCSMIPPRGGPQPITLTTALGSAVGDPKLPSIEGSTLLVSGLSLSNVSLCGGASLTIAGSGFRASGSAVDVCGAACAISSVGAQGMTCTLPSLLSHASGTHETILANASESTLRISPLPPAPTGEATGRYARDDLLTLYRGVVITLGFAGLGEAALPRGSRLGAVTLRVTPHSGDGGALVMQTRATLTCGGDDGSNGFSEDLASSSSNSSNATVEWDVMPYSLGFENDESPDLSALLRPDIEGASSTLDGCSIVVTLTPVSGVGVRSFYAAAATLMMPELRISYTPPSTASQMTWAAPERACAVNVSVATDPSGCDALEDAAFGRPIVGTVACPSFLLEAAAASTETPCSLIVNGVDLMRGCELGRLEASYRGVCAALINPPNTPRASCFDTTLEGDGAEKLGSWISAVPIGANVVLASCSRLAWAHSRTSLATALASLGATNPPTRIDDAYVLVGIKSTSGQSASHHTPALSEFRVPCCVNPSPVCHTCDQSLASASAYASCGAAASHASSTLPATSYLGNWASPSYIQQIARVSTGVNAASASVAASFAPDEVIVQLQSEDEDALDATCRMTQLKGDDDATLGAHLATDGDATSYWLAVGSPDAVLTVELGNERLIKAVEINWRHAAHSVLILFSSSADDSGDAGSGAGPSAYSWRVGASQHLASEPPTKLSLVEATGVNDAFGVRAQRIRLFITDPEEVTQAGLPMFAINELRVQSCALPRISAIAPGVVNYKLTSTPVVRSVTPRRGSSAGGTHVVLEVTGLLAELTGEITVRFAGVSCQVTSADTANGLIKCITGAHGRTSLANPGAGFAELTVKGVGTAAADDAAVYAYEDLWSQATTCKQPRQMPLALLSPLAPLLTC